MEFDEIRRSQIVYQMDEKAPTTTPNPFILFHFLMREKGKKIFRQFFSFTKKKEKKEEEIARMKSQVISGSSFLPLAKALSFHIPSFLHMCECVASLFRLKCEGLLN